MPGTKRPIHCFLGTLPCAMCGKRVGVYEWLPSPVLCAGCKRDIEKQESAMKGPHDDTKARPEVKLTTGGAPWKGPKKGLPVAKREKHTNSRCFRCDGTGQI